MEIFSFCDMRRQQLAEATSDFVGKRHSLTLRQTPKWAQSLILILAIFGGSALVASFVIKIDEVITVSGSLRPISGSVDVLAPVTATLKTVKVKEGDFVDEGQILAIYDTRDAEIKKLTLTEQLSLTESSLNQTLKLLQTEKNALLRNYEFAKDIVGRYKILEEQGAVSELNQLSQEKQLEDLQSQIIKLEQQTEQQKLQFSQRINEIRSSLSQVSLLLDNSVVKALKSGTIFDIDASDDQVVALGSTLLKIIPTDAAKAEVFVSNRDIGFVSIGQKSQVRVDAYPFTKFGDLDGEITRIGADVLPPDDTNPSYRFPVTVTLDSPVLISQGRELPLKPGMSVQANIRLREKRLISIVTDMFAKNIDGLKTLRN